MLFIAHAVFLFNSSALTEIYSLSLHDALPISIIFLSCAVCTAKQPVVAHNTVSTFSIVARDPDRKSTRLNSSHRCISYAVFCLKKKKYISISSTSIYLYIIFISQNHDIILFCL